MVVNEKVNFLVKQAVNRDGKEYYCISIKVDEVEKVLAFLTKEQYLLVTNSLKK